MRKRKIVVQNYDPAWPDTFKQLHDTIWPTISDIATTIEHVGSTAVPGLSAKPCIDMTIVVPSTSELPALIERLATIHYIHKGDQGVPGREAFDRPQNTPRHNLYACAKNNLGLRNHLALRNHLRQNPQDVQAYGDLKKQLAQKFPHDIDAYVDGKTELIVNLLAKAGLNQKEREEIQGINTMPPVQKQNK